MKSGLYNHRFSLTTVQGTWHIRLSELLQYELPPTPETHHELTSSKKYCVHNICFIFQLVLTIFTWHNSGTFVLCTKFSSRVTLRYNLLIWWTYHVWYIFCLYILYFFRTRDDIKCMGVLSVCQPGVRIAWVTPADIIYYNGDLYPQCWMW